MPDYRYVVSDSSLGKNLAEPPLTPTSPLSRILNGVGAATFTLPLDNASATRAILRGDREVTAYRDDGVAWNGPITRLRTDLRSRLVTIECREASWYFTKRVLEIDKHYNADLFTIMRDLFNYTIGKRSNGTTSGGTSINASLPRFNISPSAGGTLAGVTKALTYSGASRRAIWDIYQDLIADPTTGLDVRMDYSTGSTRQSCQRTFTMASPSLGSTKTQPLTEHVLDSYGFDEDRERAASRIHVLGAGYVYTAQNTGSISAGDILLDGVYDRTDSSSQTVIQRYAADARRLAQPPVANYFTSFVPGAALPLGWCDLGDTVALAISAPELLAVADTRRVQQIDLTPPTPSGGEELVSLGFYLPLDRLGA